MAFAALQTPIAEKFAEFSKTLEYSNMSARSASRHTSESGDSEDEDDDMTLDLLEKQQKPLTLKHI